MPSDIQSAVARIECGQSIGAGFLLNDHTVVTCYHVIKEYFYEYKQSSVSLNFCDQYGKYTVECEQFLSIDGFKDIDVAFIKIRINKEVHSHLGPITLADGVKGIHEDDYETYGFPDDSENNGEDARGRILSCRNYDNNDLPQITLADSNSISSGFSGSILYCKRTREVVGMVKAITTSDNHGRRVMVAYGIPIDTIVNRLPKEKASVLKKKKRISPLDIVSCDRTKAFQKFSLRYRQKQQLKIQHYFFVTHKKQSPKSFIKRITYYLEAEKDSSVHYNLEYSNEIQGSRDFEGSKGEFMRYIQRYMNQGIRHHNINTLQDIANEFKDKKHIIIPIYQNISTSLCTSNSFFNWFLNNFSTLEKKCSSTFLFFHVIYCDGINNRIDLFFKQRKLQNFLRKLENRREDDCTIFTEFSPVRESDVIGWIYENIVDDAILAEEIYKKNEKLYFNSFSKKNTGIKFKNGYSMDFVNIIIKKIVASQN